MEIGPKIERMNDNQIGDPIESKEYGNNIEKLLEDAGCFFDAEKEFMPNDLSRLAKLEKRFIREEKRKEWPVEKEMERCSLKKRLEKKLLSKNPKEIEKYWRNNEHEYRDSFGRGEEIKSKDSFESLKHGVLNEIIADKILKKIPDFRFKMTSSGIDIYQKIDTLGYSNNEKIIFAVQIKYGSIRNIGERGKKKSEEELEDGIVQEIDSEGGELKKNEFLNGCLKLEKELSLEDPSIVVKNIWIIIPSEYKIGEGGNYQDKLEKIIIKKIEEIKNSS